MSVSTITYGKASGFHQSRESRNPSLQHSHPSSCALLARAHTMDKKELDEAISQLGSDLGSFHRILCNSRERNLNERDLQLLAKEIDEDITTRYRLLKIYEDRFPPSRSPLSNLSSEENYPLFE